MPSKLVKLLNVAALQARIYLGRCFIATAFGFSVDTTNYGRDRKGLPRVLSSTLRVAHGETAFNHRANNLQRGKCRQAIQNYRRHLPRLLALPKYRLDLFSIRVYFR